MSDFKEYPRNAPEIRQLIENRRHYLSLIFAMAVISTFQLFTSFGWWSYSSEAYFHFTSPSESLCHFLECILLVVFFTTIFISIYVRKSGLIAFLIVCYFAHVAFKLIRISTVYPEFQQREKFTAMLRYSEYDMMFLIYDFILFISSVINLGLGGCAIWHFTPVVIIKMPFNDDGRKKAVEAIKNARKTFSVTCVATNSTSTESMDVSNAVGVAGYKAKMKRTKTMKAKIDEKADVTVSNKISVKREVTPGK